MNIEPSQPARRDEREFGWSAGCGMPAYAQLAGVPYDRVFRDADAIAEAYLRGKPMAIALFGPDVSMSGPNCAGVSYGHINALGAKLIFPENSEVAHQPIYGSLTEGIRELRKERDFSRQGMFPFYLSLWEALKRRFPTESIPFAGFGAEGPITTGWLLRGHDFFTDTLEQPELAQEYLRAVTESVARYFRLVRRLNGKPEFTSENVGLADDVAAMISPAHWPDQVMPHLERYYAAQTSGPRTAHIEDLRPQHLKFLDELRLNRFDPSVSPRLTPELIRDSCGVPFDWRLNSTHYVGKSEADIQRWVFAAAAGGAASVWTSVWRDMCDARSAEKVRAFIRAAKRVMGLFAQGCPRDKLMDQI